MKNKDPYHRMMEESLILFFVVIFIVISTSIVGCSTTVAPNLKIPEQSCPRLVLPPVPQDVALDIFGDKVTANAGGDLILRGYVRCRSLYTDVPAK